MVDNAEERKAGAFDDWYMSQAYEVGERLRDPGGLVRARLLSARGFCVSPSP